MYRSQGAMGEYFAAQSGVGQYEQAAAGMGEYFAAQGLGEFFAYTPPGMQGLGGPLVNWARQEEAEAGHKGIFGLGEFFAYTPPGMKGLGADGAYPAYCSAFGLQQMGNLPRAAILAGLGAGIGYLVTKKKKRGALIGAGVGVVISYVNLIGRLTSNIGACQ